MQHVKPVREEVDWVGWLVFLLLGGFLLYVISESGQEWIASLNETPTTRTRAIFFGALTLFFLYLLYQQTKPVVISPKKVWFVPLYAVTLWWELWGAFIRFLAISFGGFIVTFPFVLVAITASAASDFSGKLDDSETILRVWVILLGLISYFAAYLPIFSSLFTLLDPRVRVDATSVYALGAREPTRDELQKIIDGLTDIAARARKDLGAPATWLVMDDPLPNSYTVGETVYLSRELINSPYLVPAMVHELGHIKRGDGKRLLAIRRLVIPLAYLMGIDQRADPIGVIAGGGVNQATIRGADERMYYRMQAWRTRMWLAFVCGGLGLFTMARSWAAYWRQQDFLADQFVIECGFSQELLELLTLFQAFDIAQPFLLSGRPYTAERIDRLKGKLPSITVVSQPVETTELITATPAHSLSVRVVEETPVPFQRKELPKLPEEEG